MKSILISIKPKYVAEILKHRKTIEVRKTKPKCDLPINVYIYCTKGDHIGYLSNRYVGKVVAKFTLRKVEQFIDGIACATYPNNREYLDETIKKACLTYEQLCDYAPNESFYAWEISELKVYDKPKDLIYFGLLRAPQSWCKVSEMAIAFSEEFEKMERKMKPSSKKGSVKIKPIEWSVPTYTIKK